MTTTSLPSAAAWRHRDSRDGFEVAFLDADGDGYRVRGSTSAVEAGDPWIVDYAIELDAAWRTRAAQVRLRSRAGARELAVTADGQGSWRIDGSPAPELDGCLDLDLESSALTNAFPVARMRLALGAAAEAPAAWVRALDLGVERLEQRYERMAPSEYDYAAPELDFTCRLVYDDAGLVLDYPGIAVRAG
jgi:uncharacterized protein